MTDNPITIARAHQRIDFLEDRMTSLEARVPKTAPVEVNVTADTESLTAYVHRLETLINDIEKGLSERLDVHRTDIDTLENDVSTWDDIFDNVIARIAKLERAALSENENDRPQRDTSWQPHDVLLREGMTSPPVAEHNRVVVMLRSGEIVGPRSEASFAWSECGEGTIVAWRYAKEGE